MEVIELARRIRAQALRMIHGAKSSHVGSCLSAADILAVLYGKVMKHDPRNPGWPQRDRLIVSKGHAAAAVYAALAETGYFPVEWLNEYGQDGTRFPGHVCHKTVPGVEFSTGALGHGLSVGAGMALGAMRAGQEHRVFVLLSDGELDEGSTWEAALFAGHHGLEQLVAIVDYNHHQAMGRTEQVLDLEPLDAKWTAFGWSTRVLDGHDVDALSAAGAAAPFDKGRPSCILAQTVKGKGVSYMEDKLLWHYRYPREQDLQNALAELGVPA